MTQELYAAIGRSSMLIWITFTGIIYLSCVFVQIYKWAVAYINDYDEIEISKYSWAIAKFFGMDDDEEYSFFFLIGALVIVLGALFMVVGWIVIIPALVLLGFVRLLKYFKKWGI